MAKKNRIKSADKINKKQNIINKKIEASSKKKEDEIEVAANQPEADVKKNKKISNAKRLGVKSVIVKDDNNMFITSFGKDNDAKIEYHVVKEESDNKDKYKESEESFTKKENYNFYIEKNNDNEFNIDHKINIFNASNLKAKPNNPLFKNDISDQTGLKKYIEKYYFKNPESIKDNIHIQIAYCIMNLDKYISVYINDIVYSFSNVITYIQETDNNESNADLSTNEKKTDIIGTFRSDERYTDNCLSDNNYKALKRNIGLYGILYEDETTGNNENTDLESNSQNALGRESRKKHRKTSKEVLDENNRITINEKELYYILSSLSYIRQSVAHGGRVSSLYKADIGEDAEKYEVISEIFKKYIGGINDDFFINSRNNINRIIDIYNASNNELEKKLVQEFYDFSIKKAYKNIGVSIKTLREKLIEKMKTKNDLTDTNLRRISLLTDFILYDYFMKNDIYLKDCIARLRMDSESIEEKDTYNDIIKYLLEKDELKNIFQNLIDKLNKETYQNYSIASVNDSAPRYDIEMSGGDLSFFSNLIFIMSLFLDGKEINELLTGLINKLKNIEGMLKVANQIDVRIDFKDDYKALDMPKISKIIDELAVIRSIVRMNEKIYEPKFIRAKKIMGKKDGERESKEVNNFILNNVIISKWYKYIVKYADPNSIGNVIHNQSIVKMVINKIPEKQIKTSFDSLKKTRKDIDKTVTDFNKQREIICEKLILWNYNEVFSDLNKPIKPSAPEEPKKPIIPVETAYESKELYEKKLKKYNKKIWKYENKKIPAYDIAGKKYNESMKKYNKDIEKYNKAKENESAYKNLIQLYLEVLYFVVKNLVNINSRYFMAFNCLERDSLILGVGTEENDKQKILYNKIDEFIDTYINECFLTDQNNNSQENNTQNDNTQNDNTQNDISNYIKKREEQNSIINYKNKYNDKLKNNLKILKGEKDIHDNILTYGFYTSNARPSEPKYNVIYCFRNNVEHLDAIRYLGDSNILNIEERSCIRDDKEHTIEKVDFNDIEFNSWFELYHYIVQIVLLKDSKNGYNNKPVCKEFLEKISKYCIPNNSKSSNSASKNNESQNSDSKNNESKDTKKYSRDLLHILCLYFIYNIPRYKNLSTEELFDMNNDIIGINDKLTSDTKIK